MVGEWDSNGARKYCRMYQEVLCFFNDMGGVGELIVVDDTIKNTEYIDILDYNLLNSVGNTFMDSHDSLYIPNMTMNQRIHPVASSVT